MYVFRNALACYKLQAAHPKGTPPLVQSSCLDMVVGTTLGMLDVPEKAEPGSATLQAVLLVSLSPVVAVLPFIGRVVRVFLVNTGSIVIGRQGPHLAVAGAIALHLAALAALRGGLPCISAPLVAELGNSVACVLGHVELMDDVLVFEGLLAV